MCKFNSCGTAKSLGIPQGERKDPFCFQQAKIQLVLCVNSARGSTAEEEIDWPGSGQQMVVGN